MTIDEIRATDKPMLKMTDIAPVIGTHPSRLLAYARDGQLAALIGGGVFISGRTAKISRDAFLRWYEGRQNDE